MGIILIIIGTILIMFGYVGYKQTSTIPSTNNISMNDTLENNNINFKNSEIKIAELEENINILSNTLEDVLQKIDNMSQVSSFSYELSQYQAKNEYDEIKEAFQRGEDITDIAKRFNRGKGEIQLILSLRE